MYYPRLILILILFLLLPLITAAPHTQYNSFSAVEEQISLSNNRLSIADDAVYRTSYYSVNGATWQALSLSGDSYDTSTAWISNSASAYLPASLQTAGEHYILIYSCTQDNDRWDCHGRNQEEQGFWQLIIINNTLPEGTLYLVEDGQPLADIVVDPEAPNAVTIAGRYFQEFIHDMSGVELPINGEPNPAYGFHVYIGESEHTRSLGITAEGCRDDGFKMVSGDDYLVLLGDDEPFNNIRLTTEEWDAITGHYWINEYNSNIAYVDGLEVYSADGKGSLNAVYEFMHDQGMRWYYPTGIGRITPQKQDIAFAPRNDLINPDFSIRDLFLYYQDLRYLRDTSYPDTYLDREKWVLSLRINDVEIYPLAHGINAVTNRAETIVAHPEYWALLENGTRLDPYFTNYPNQDLCNEDLKAENVEFVKTMVDTFGVKRVSVAPGDGFTHVSHSSPECASMASEDRPREGVLSNYVWNYVNDVAWEVYEEYGDEVQILNAAYTTYKLPPDEIRDPRGMAPNVIVSIARWRTEMTDPEMKQYYHDLADSWLAILPSDQIKFADYYLHNRIGSDTQSVPFYHPHLISEDLQYHKGKSLGAFIEVFGNTYVEGGLYDAEWDSFAATSLNVYIISRLWWDADQDVDALLEEYYDLYFGPAREEMKALVEYSEERAVYSRGDPTVISTMRSLITAALEAAQTHPDPIYEERVKLVYDLIYSDYEGEVKDIDSCQDLNVTNMVYTLTQDVSSGGTCFVIDADGVTLDCAGHTITYSTDGIRADDNAIYNQEFFTYRGDYFTMKNCIVQDGSYLSGNTTGTAIELRNADRCVIQNVTINTSGIGIYSGSSVSNRYLNNTIYAYEGNAFTGTINPSKEPGYYNILDGNEFYSVEANGIKLFYLDNVTLTNNIFSSETTRGLSTYQVTNLHEENNVIIDG